MDVTRDYYLLLIDVRGSTKLAPPDLARRTMNRLEKTLARLNDEMKRDLVIGLSLSYGDEVAALLRRAAHLFDVVAAVRDTLHPDATIRFVAVRGKIGVASDDIRQVGGPVFKQTDDAMVRLKKQRGFCSWLLKDRALDDTLNSLTGMSNALVEEMTDYQRRVYASLGRGMSGKLVAKRLGKYPQSVSDAGKRGRAKLVLAGEATIRRMLSAMNKGQLTDVAISTDYH